MHITRAILFFGGVKMTGRELITYILENYMENATMVLRRSTPTGAPWVHINPEGITNGHGIMIIEHPGIER